MPDEFSWGLVALVTCHLGVASFLLHCHLYSNHNHNEALDNIVPFLMASFFPSRTEYKAYGDAKPAKMIRAKSQYLPPVGKTSLETSYSATFKGQAPLQPANNKALERRRIRSLYSEPYIDPAKQVRLS